MDGKAGRRTQSGGHSSAVLPQALAQTNPHTFPVQPAARTGAMRSPAADLRFQNRNATQDGCSAVAQFGVMAPQGRVPRVRPGATTKTLRRKCHRSRKAPRRVPRGGPNIPRWGAIHYFDGRERGGLRPPTWHGVESRSPLPCTGTAHVQHFGHLLQPIVDLHNIPRHGFLLLLESGLGDLGKLLLISLKRLLQ
jgi:hypothetical protein